MKYILIVIVSITLLSLSACTAYVFNHPMTISTKSDPVKNFQPIGTIKTTSCNYLFVLIPIVSDPRDIYDNLLAEAKKAGGDTVIDVQVQGTDDSFFWIFPPIARFCFEANGTAARYK